METLVLQLGNNKTWGIGLLCKKTISSYCLNIWCNLCQSTSELNKDNVCSQPASQKEKTKTFKLVITRTTALESVEKLKSQKKKLALQNLKPIYCLKWSWDIVHSALETSILLFCKIWVNTGSKLKFVIAFFQDIVCTFAIQNQICPPFCLRNI